VGPICDRLSSCSLPRSHETGSISGPLVFVSHDSRDADLAEAFCLLLSSVSAGMLKTFRSSDRKGSSGFEYGLEWYPELMKRLLEASDVVCLFTQRSLDRPWILYEAGVAKGKLEAPVQGLALGISLTALSGPFAQFQNCDDDLESMTKLVIQLVKKLPGADPVYDIVVERVRVFQTKAIEILARDGQVETPEQGDPESVPRLFEEIKLMFNDLPGRMEAVIGPRESVQGRKQTRDHLALEEFGMFRHRANDTLDLLVSFTAIRDDAPWIYELALELYRSVVRGDQSAALRILEDLHESVDFLIHGPGQMLLRRGRDSRMPIQRIAEVLTRFEPEFDRKGARQGGGASSAGRLSSSAGREMWPAGGGGGAGGPGGPYGGGGSSGLHGVDGEKGKWE
jgi:uncharacterized membrane protein YgcG